MADRVKYVFEKEMELAVLDLKELVEKESDVKAAQIQIIAHNHSPWTIPQCVDAVTEAPGMFEQYSQPGRLFIDVCRSVFEEYLAQELAVYYQQLMQQKQMEEVKKSQEKLAIAPAGFLDEGIAVDDITRKRNSRK